MENAAFEKELAREAERKAVKKEDSVSVSAVVTSSPKRLFLRLPNCHTTLYKKALNLCEIFEGSVELVIYDLSQKSYIQTGKGVDADTYVLKQLSDLIGADNVVLR